MNTVTIDQSYKLMEERRKFIPDDFERTIVAIGTAADIDLQEWFKLLTSSLRSKPILWKLSGLEKTLYPISPISLNISRGETLFFAENEKLRIYATGESRDIAIEAFVEQVLYFYEYYKNLSCSQVTGEAQRLKKLYNKHFKEEEA